MEAIKKIIIIFMILFGIILVDAQANQIYEQGKNISLAQSCYRNGTYCSSSAVCNITVLNPNLEILVINNRMTNQVSFYNFTLNGNVTDKVGEYEYRITCTDTSLSNFGTFKFKVTASGREPSLAEAIIYIVILTITVFIFLFSVWGYTRFEWKNKFDLSGIVKINHGTPIKITLLYVNYLILMFIVFLNWQISLNLVLLDFTTPMLKSIFYFMAAIAAPLMVGLFVFGLIILIYNRNLQKTIARGLPFR